MYDVTFLMEELYLFERLQAGKPLKLGLVHIETSELPVLYEIVIF